MRPPSESATGLSKNGMLMVICSEEYPGEPKVNTYLHRTFPHIIIIIIIIIIITDLYRPSPFRSEDTESLDAAQED